MFKHSWKHRASVTPSKHQELQLKYVQLHFLEMSFI